MRTIEQMVQQEINCCLSSLISTLASGESQPGSDLAELCDRALGLAEPVPDYEEAAIQEKWTGPHKDQFGAIYFAGDDNGQMITWSCANWEELCRDQEIEPIDSEVYEHWAVSQWLAERLLALGEKVDTDFANLNVWARQTTGQQICADGVIARIYKAMMEA